MNPEGSSGPSLFTLGDYSNVDAAADPDALVDLMNHTTALDGVGLARRVAIEALSLTPGARVLDLGCGSGDSTAELARAVGPSGGVVGVDLSEAMVAAATERFGTQGLPLHFQQGDAHDLPFADASFDGCRTERMLCHVSQPLTTLAEMIRVTRPGGRIVAIDVDSDLIAVDHPDPAFVRRLVSGAAGLLANGHIGRQLPRLLQRAGLTNVAVNGVVVQMPFSIARVAFQAALAAMEANGTATEAEIQGFWAQVEGAELAGEFFCASTMFIVAGTRPEG